MNANKGIPEKWMLQVNFEKFSSINQKGHQSQLSKHLTVIWPSSDL